MKNILLMYKILHITHDTMNSLIWTKSQDILQKTQQQSNIVNWEQSIVQYEDKRPFWALRVCVLWNGYLISFLYSGRCRWTNKNVIKLLVLHFFIHTLQTVGFGYLSWIVVFPSSVPGKRSCPGERGHLRCTGHARVGPCGRGTPASVRVSQHFALTRACPETCNKNSNAVRMFVLLAHLVWCIVVTGCNLYDKWLH